jgi:hypothetical protein
MYTRDEMKDYLRTSDYCMVNFKKADNTIREMKATLNEAHMPVDERPTEDQKNYAYNDDGEHSVIRVWDLDKEAWRSFRVDRVCLFSAWGVMMDTLKGGKTLRESDAIADDLISLRDELHRKLNLPSSPHEVVIVEMLLKINSCLYSGYPHKDGE